MIDENVIRENYASMMDSQLIEIAENDGHQLNPAAFEILQHEFQKRNLDQSYIDSVIETKTLIHEHKIEKIKESIQEDYEKTIWNYILEEKENGATDSQIIHGLKERGLDDEHANMILLDIKPKLEKIIDNQDTKMLAGGLAFVLGLFATMWTYSNTQLSGGYFIIAWGALLFGPIRFFTGLSEKINIKNYLQALLKMRTWQ